MIIIIFNYHLKFELITFRLKLNFFYNKESVAMNSLSFQVHSLNQSANITRDRHFLHLHIQGKQTLLLQLYFQIHYEQKLALLPQIHFHTYQILVNVPKPCAQQPTHGSVEDDDQIEPTLIQVHSSTHDDNPTQNHEENKKRANQVQVPTQEEQGKPTATSNNSLINKVTDCQYSDDQATLQHCLNINQMHPGRNQPRSVISTHGSSHQGPRTLLMIHTDL